MKNKGKKKTKKNGKSRARRSLIDLGSKIEHEQEEDDAKSVGDMSEREGDDQKSMNKSSVKTLGRYSSTGNMELLSMHKNRLVIEKDAKMLANRISMLQMEEDKIMKKINQTRKRANDIMKAKKRNDQMFEQRMIEREERLRKEDDDRQKWLNDRVQRQANKDKNVKAIKKAKNEEYKIGKTMTIQNDIYKKKFLAGLRKQNNIKKSMVKQEEEERARKFRIMEEKKKKENQEAYSTKVNDEKNKILENEKRIKEMERMEAELLNRLKNSQQMEQAEYGKLEKALKVSNQACEERRKKVNKIRKPRPAEITKLRNSISTHPSEKASNP